MLERLTTGRFRQLLLGISAFALIISAGCTGYLSSTPSEPIAQVESVNVSQFEDTRYCAVEYNISKQQDVIIEVRQGVNSEFLGQKYNEYRADESIEGFRLVSGGSGQPIEINAYEAPENGTGESIQLYKATVSEDCAASEVSA